MSEIDVKWILFELQKQRDLIYQLAKKVVTGRMVKILSNYNGQPYGSSRPSMKGEVVAVTGVCPGSDLQLWLLGYNCSISLDEVEFIDEAGDE